MKPLELQRTGASGTTGYLDSNRTLEEEGTADRRPKSFCETVCEWASSLNPFSARKTQTPTLPLPPTRRPATRNSTTRESAIRAVNQRNRKLNKEARRREHEEREALRSATQILGTKVEQPMVVPDLLVRTTPSPAQEPGDLGLRRRRSPFVEDDRGSSVEAVASFPSVDEIQSPEKEAKKPTASQNGKRVSPNSDCLSTETDTPKKKRWKPEKSKRSDKESARSRSKEIKKGPLETGPIGCTIVGDFVPPQGVGSTAISKVADFLETLTRTTFFEAIDQLDGGSRPQKAKTPLKKPGFVAWSLKVNQDYRLVLHVNKETNHVQIVDVVKSDSTKRSGRGRR